MTPAARAAGGLASVALGLSAAWLVLGTDTGPASLRLWHAVVLTTCSIVIAIAAAAQRPVAAWSALLIAGAVGGARLLVTPPFAVYPYFPLPTELVSTQRAALGVIAVQLVVVVMGAPALRDVALGIGRWMLTNRRRTTAAVMIIGTSLAVPARSADFSAAQLLTSGTLLAIALGNTTQLLLALCRSDVPPWLQHLGARLSVPGADSGEPSWDRRVPWLAAVAVVLIASAVSLGVFEGMPHIDDSVSYLFHARYFALGRLSVAAPPDSAAFGVDETLIDAGRWFGYGFPGWPAVLSLGVRAGLPWSVNPLLAGALVLLTHAAVRHTVDRGTAHFTVLLMAVSPWLWFMSGEFMPHPLAATCTIASLLAAVRLRGGAGPRWVLVAGFSLGLLATVRPLDAALAALLVSACLVAPGAPRRPVALGATGVLAMAISAVVLPYNQALTGRATYTPQMLWTDRRWGPGTDRLGFGGDIGIREWSNIDPLPGHGVADVLVNLNRNLAITQAELLGWCVGSLLLFVVGLALRPPRGNTAPWRSLVGLFVGGYCLYWFSGGPDLGARYWYPALPGFAVLSVLGATALCRVWQHPRSGAAVLRSAIVLTLAALVSVVPARAVTKFHGYRLIGSDVAALVRSEGIRNSVVFLRTPQRSRYQAAFHLNSVPLGDDNVFARDAGAASRAAVLRAFPGRTVWVLEADSLSGVLRVAARPDA